MPEPVYENVDKMTEITESPCCVSTVELVLTTELTKEGAGVVGTNGAGGVKVSDVVTDPVAGVLNVIEDPSAATPTTVVPAGMEGDALVSCTTVDGAMVVGNVPDAGVMVVDVDVTTELIEIAAVGPPIAP